MKTSHRIHLIVLAVVGILLPPASWGGSVYYSFEGETSGIARVDIDPRTGAILAHEALFAEEYLERPRKMAMTADSAYIALTCDTLSEPNVIIAGQGAAAGIVHRLTLPERPDEIRAFGHRFLVGGNDGYVWVIDAESGEVMHEWNSRRDLIPTGRQPEDIYILPDGKTAIISFQKDSRGGRHMGSRLVVFDLEPDFGFRFDLQLPRNRPDLHYDPEVNKREQGPSPEVIFTSPRLNTGVVTLDLYGALATFDLDAALERGKYENLEYLPTAADGSWGHTYPDRGLHFEWDGHEYIIIFNVGPAAGAAMFDVGARAIIEHYPTGTGLEYPVLLREAGLLIGAPIGKRKDRGSEGLDKWFEPEQKLYVWDVSGLTPQGAARLEVLDMPEFIFRVAAPAGEETPLVVLFTGPEDEPERIVVFDAVQRQPLATAPALGAAQRLLLQKGR